ncbi:flavin-containing monooxygenase [Noviherbaspirillum saxi]|uniref:NAD(P)/FAD-dependent oxidoreductase n=1 Tax=Noviherbaspirillum saxi TaxID=2320863 RepID=A0A3A3G2L1_9BURK|nr:NAD(P)/FAD-dependent oxidoreductase [Noviherbaspirillum saxi]RJF92303.1 NAD(P)/FAD-dependent oxidoreductase [Noviherbaspirillum saxi]
MNVWLKRPASRPHLEENFLDVLIVGAGLSGIGAAYHLQQRCPDKRYAILEARQAIGGTWDLFRYPGIRSDSDMYTLGYVFKPWTNPQAIADGPSIRSYIRETANEAGIMQHVRLGQKVTAVAWSSEEACWTVEVERVASGERRKLRARFLYMCSGYYSYDEAYRPQFAGEDDYRGTVVLPQFWPEDLDYRGKRVVVIGSGATAVTLVPAMAKSAAHVTMLQRSPSYVVTRPSVDTVADRLRHHLPARLAYSMTRWKNVIESMFLYRLARRYPEQTKRRIIEMAAKELGTGIDVGTHFTPSYKPWDQRVCLVPDGDMFQAIREGHASVVTDTIERFSSNGILLKSGRELHADIVVMATGLKLNLLGGAAVTIDGRPCIPNDAMAYKGMMLSDVPNLAMAFGYTNASWTLKADLTAAYVCRLLNYMDRHHKAIAVPRREAGVEPQPFLSFTSGYVQRAHTLLPKQGSRRPWQVYQNYLQDLLTIRFGRIADGVMRFGPKGTMP